MQIWKPQELRSKGKCVNRKYDEMIAQRENDSQVNGDMEHVSRFTLKNIE